MFRFARAMISPLSLMAGALAWGSANAANTAPQATTNVAVGPQYDSTHVYVAPADLDPFVASFIATFGGHASKPVVSTVTSLQAARNFNTSSVPSELSRHSRTQLLSPIHLVSRGPDTLLLI
jgi:hypothetical protein